MRSRVTLVVEVEHPATVDPAAGFVYYFAEVDDHEYGTLHDFLPSDVDVVSEEWEEME